MIIYDEHLVIDDLHSTKLFNLKTDHFNCPLRCIRLAYLRNKVLTLAKKWEKCII